MTDMQTRIRDRVATRQKRQEPRREPRVRSAPPVVQAQDIHIPKEEQSGFWGAFLATCILLLAIATVPALYYKGQDRQVVPQNHTVVEREISAPVTPQVPQGQDNRMNEALMTRLADVEKGYKAQQHRLWMMVLAHNENANLAKQMDGAHHKVNDRGFITFDENWQFSRMPETMALTPEQIEQIKSGPK